MSIRMLKAHLDWMERHVRFHRARKGAWVHAAEMGNEEIKAYLTHLAVKRNVFAGTQNQALAALLFLFRDVLGKEFQVNAVRAKKPERLPVVLSEDEVRRVLDKLLEGPMRLLGFRGCRWRPAPAAGR